MQLDLANSTTRPTHLRTRVCIIGAGIAGLTLAHKLAEQGIDIILLEAGGLTPDTNLPVDLLAAPYAAATQDRTQAFGGTSLLWGGQLLPLPSTDNNPPSTNRHPQRSAAESKDPCISPGEPITPASPNPWPDITPHTIAAQQLLAVNTLPYEADAFFNANHQPQPLTIPGINPRLSKFIPFNQRNLAQTVGKSLRQNPRVQLLLNAPVSELLLTPERNRIEAALIPNGPRIEADHFVLTAGTIETVRLLLASNSITPEGLGNAHDQLGRNLHDHLTLPAATLTNPSPLLRDLRPWVFPNKTTGPTLHALKLEASLQLCADLNLNPTLAFLTIEEPADSGIAHLRNLLRARQQQEPKPPLTKLPAATLEALRLFTAAKFQHRRYISPVARVTLQINAAQTTPTLSRITLSPRRDSNNQPLPAIAWHITLPDLETFPRFATHLRRHLASPDLRWLPALTDPDPTTLLPHLDDARHPMGGAIMGPDPRTSVVDPNLTVHNIPNLSIASAATFPDGRAQLPTLPLLALTLRLADRLATLLKP
jgi:choline dehydrogenase-like flavoprotein